MNFDLQSLAARLGGRLDGPPDLRIHGVAGLRDAEAGDCSYLADDRYRTDLTSTRASAVLLLEGVETTLPAIRVDDPRRAFQVLLDLFARPRSALFPPGIAPNAHIDPTAVVGEGVHVGHFAVIGPGCRVDEGAVIGAGTVLLADVEVGQQSLLYPGVYVREDCSIGRRVIVHCGAVIGSDGFGYARDAGRVAKIPQIGRVVLEDEVEIGANVCIDRATAGRTVIGAGTKIDNLVQVGHNVRIGHRVAISAQSGISGSCEIGSDVILAGQVGLADHVRIGDRVRIGAKSGVSHHLADDATVSGIPAREHRAWKRQQAHVARLQRYVDELAALRRRIDELEKRSGAAPTENA